MSNTKLPWWAWLILVPVLVVLGVIALGLFLSGVVIWLAIYVPLKVMGFTLSMPASIMAWGHLPVRDSRVS